MTAPIPPEMYTPSFREYLAAHPGETVLLRFPSAPLETIDGEPLGVDDAQEHEYRITAGGRLEPITWEDR